MTKPITATNAKLKKSIANKVLVNLVRGASFRTACSSAGVHTATFWRWRQKSPELDEQVHTILEARTQTVEDSLYNAALDGNVTAMIFWLINRSGGRWRDRRNIEHTGADGGPVEVRHIHDLSDDELLQIAKEGREE